MFELAFVFAGASLFLFGVADALALLPSKRLSPITIALLIDITSVIGFGALSFWFWDGYLFTTDVWFAMAAGFVGYTGFLFYIYSLKTGSVGVSSSIANAYPILVLLFGFLVLGEVLSLAQVGAIVVIMLGVFGVSTKFSLRDFYSNSLRSSSVLFALAAMVFWGLQVIFMDYALGSLPAFEVSHIMSVTGFVLGTALYIWNGGTFRTLRTAKHSDVVVCVSLSLMYFTGIYTLNLALQIGAIGIVSAIVGAAPFVSAIFAYLFFRERLSGKEWFAVLVVVIGLVTLGVLG